MNMITPGDVIRRIELYLENGASYPATNIPLSFRSLPVAPTTIEQSTPFVQESAKPVNVLIKFRHGLGDAVQLTTVLQHLRHAHPEWNVDVAALIGKHSAFHGLCRRVFVLDREPLPSCHDRVLDLDWHECHSCFAHCPSTKAERCLQDIFHLTPIPDLCTYKIHCRDRTKTLARAYLAQICQGKAGDGGRFPSVLIHYEGNTSGDQKNISTEIVRQLCDLILGAGFVPVILDWDHRTRLADGKRIHNPHTQMELWGWTGTGDAEALAALIESSSLMIGVDSGPLHVAGATTTPTIGVWTGHHPLHYFGHADNITHLVPENHLSLLRGNRAVGETYFRQHYRFQTYGDLARALPAAVRQHLKNNDGSLVYTRNFWIRNNNAEQDLVVVQDIAEQDSYRIDELPMPRPVVVDVGAHIGCFGRKFHDRNPLARIIAVECCPDNILALRKNIGGFATILQAAVTYEKDVALLNAVFPNCVTTGGSTVISRQALERKVAAHELLTDQNDNSVKEYWADFRPVQTITLEDILEQHGFDHIDVLKLDCEGSEFSILRNTTVLDRIGIIVGEYHGKEAFLQLVQERFADWHLRILKDGELGLFWLSRSSPL
jgi:FkbM family methyltransferase